MFVLITFSTVFSYYIRLCMHTCAHSPVPSTLAVVFDGTVHFVSFVDFSMLLNACTIEHFLCGLLVDIND